MRGEPGETNFFSPPGSFRQHGQCLEREQATTSHSVGKAGLVPAADRAGDRHPPGNGGRISAGGWGGGAARRLGTETTRKTGHTSGHRLCRPPTGEPPSEAASECAIRPRRSPRASACEPYRELIELALARGRNAMAIWQDLVSFHGFASRYPSVKRFVRQLRGTQTPPARVVIETAPGEEAQVDYGTGPMVRDPLSGTYRRTRLFMMTLAYSRKAIRLLTFRSSSRIWAELHEQAFRRLGGATRVVVLDNLREGVLVPDVYDPTLHR